MPVGMEEGDIEGTFEGLAVSCSKSDVVHSDASKA